MSYWNMPDHYVPRPWDPMDPAFEGAECANEGCDQIEYVGTLNSNDGICNDCHNKEDDQ